MSKLFPIQTETACKLKWSWSSLWLNDATTASCFRCNLHKFDTDSFDFHNTQDKLDQRQTMLDGNWPTGGCQYCEHIEKNNGTSDRILHKQIPGFPVELETNQTEKYVSPTIVEIYFDNKCNLSCVYCVPRLSSKISAEVKKFGKGDFDFGKTEIPGYYDIFPDHDKVENHKELIDKFWDWMSNNSKNLQRLHLLGGEPFYQKEIDDVIIFFKNNPNPQLELNAVSNLSIPPEKFENYINQFKCLTDTNSIKRFDITASIDCWGDEQTYARTGLNLKWFEKNMDYLVKQDKWLRININHTMSTLTINTMPVLYEKIKKWRKHKNVYIFTGIVGHWDFLHPKIFSYEKWKSSLDKVIELQQSMINENNQYDINNEINGLKGIISVLKQVTENNNKLIDRMGIYLDELDRRRNTNWRNIFTYLI